MSSLVRARPLPRDPAWDNTFALLSEGYAFMPRRFAQHQSDIFETRLMLRRAVCVMGEEAAHMFFQPGRFTRKGAIPPSTLLLLQDRHSVQWLDGPEHDHRKEIFLRLATPSAVDELVEAFTARWMARLPRWEAAGRIVLHDEMQELLTRAVCAWAGIALEEALVPARTREFAAMIDGAGAVGPRNWRGLVLRSRAERWARRLVADIRSGARAVPEGRAARIVAEHRRSDGRPLDGDVAAVELLNVLRPTVAVARFIAFAAHALHEHPRCREPIASGDAAFATMFVQEVRRFYPYFTAIGGRVMHSFDWRGHHFPRDTWMIFDVYGTHHDPRSWVDPDTFRPERFAGLPARVAALAAQGGGDMRQGHRCPGEPATIALLRAAVRLLASLRYEVPAQDLSIDLARMPALPADGFVMDRVRSPSSAVRAP